MKTAMVDGVRQDLSYRTSTDMYTRLTNPLNGKTAQFGADAYTPDNSDDLIVLVATSHNGSTLQATTKVISLNEWESLVSLHDVYNGTPFHFAVMSKLGFE